MDFVAQIQQCAPTVHFDTMRRIIQVESGFNPYAVGVVGAHLQRQPRTRAEALATIRWLDASGYNYSVGLGQVNKRNFRAHGLSVETALAVCPNLRAAGEILTACYARATRAFVTPQDALRAAFSCYESGNFRTGFRDGYVLKILDSSEARFANPQAPNTSKKTCESLKASGPSVAETGLKNRACEAASSAKVQ